MLMVICSLILFLQQGSATGASASIFEEKMQADTLHRSGKYEEAIKAYQKILEKDPKNKSVLMMMGTSLVLSKKAEEGVTVFKKLVESNPDDADAYGSLSYGLLAVQKYDEAKIAALKTIELNPKHSTAYSYLGSAENKLGHVDLAISAYKKSIEVNPRLASVYNNLGYIYSNNKQLGDLESLLLAGINYFPNDVTMLTGLARIYFRNESFDKASVYLRKITELKKDDANNWFLLGTVESQLNHNEAASDAFAAGLKIKPGDAQAWGMKSHAEINLFHGYAAIADAQEYLTLSGPGDSHYPYVLITVWIGNKLINKSTEADFALNEILEKTNSVSWQAEIARFLLRRTPREEFLSKATDVDKKTEANAYIGVELILSGQKEKALPYLNWVKENGNKKFVEYRLALAFLNR